MKLFWAYIKERKNVILAAFVFAAVFAAAFLMYHLPTAALLYPALLCALFAAVFTAFDFVRVKQKHDVLALVKTMTAETMDALPEKKTVDDCDYQDIIESLRHEALEERDEAQRRYRDMMEYYTVWVHQIKTPITSMRLTLEKEDTATSRKLSVDLSGIEQYVSMVLAFLRLDGESGDYVFGRYELDGIIEQAITKFASEFIDRRLRLEYTPTNKTVVTDEKWLLFVLEQLLSNALKYTREGGIKIYMRGQNDLVIEDTGIGISKNDLPRVFEMGYTGKNGRLDMRSSGIGLYLCRRICQKLGVGLDITSDSGRGTTVILGLEQYELKKE